jgi:hypothetical protein
VNDPQWHHLRVGDADREQAIAALGEHMSLGRLTVDEYGERASGVAAAKTRGELSEQFADLPEPGPRFDARTDASGATRPRLSKESDSQQDESAPSPRDGERARWHAGAAILPLAMVIAAVVIGVFDKHGFFLLIPAIFLLRGWAHGAGPHAGRRHHDPRMRH